MAIFKRETCDLAVENKEYIVQCSCGSPEHLIQVSWFLPNEKYCTEDYEELYIHYSLLKARVWKRIWYAIKYVFGYQSRFGGYGEMVLYKQDVDKLIEVLQEYQKDIIK